MRALGPHHHAALRPHGNFEAGGGRQGRRGRTVSPLSTKCALLHRIWWTFSSALANGLVHQGTIAIFSVTSDSVLQLSTLRFLYAH